MAGTRDRRSKNGATGVVALVFLVLGFQLAVFVIKVIERPQAAEALAAASTDVSDNNNLASETAGGFSGREHFSASGTKNQSSKASKAAGGARRSNDHGRQASEAAGGIRRSDLFSGARRIPEQRSERIYETFPFDPNTVSLKDLQRLGLSERQAATIENYRQKGGRFRNKDDFRKMYVVTDTLFARLEPYIKIPKVELNAADSAALVSLRGIGPYYARKIIEYRERLGGFLYKAQLLEIEGLDEERLAGFTDDIEIDTTRCNKIDLWHATDSLLARHPYLGEKGARSITRYKKLYDTTRWTLADLEKEHALPKENIEKLKKYIEIQ